MCFDYDGVLLRSETRTARKTHKCHECGAEIKSGDRYFFGAWPADGTFHQIKSCAGCEEVRDKIGAIEIENGCGAWESKPPYGLLGECAPEYGFRLPGWAQEDS